MFGDWSLLTAFLYILGLLLLLVEAMAPGFGVAGISGIVCVLASIVMISSSFLEAMLILIATTAILVLIVIGLYKMGYGRGYIRKLILNTEQKNEEGYTGAQDYSKYLGMNGVVVTPLRSAGTVLLDGKRVDAVSEGEFIQKDEEVEVIKVEGYRVVVRKK